MAKNGKTRQVVKGWNRRANGTVYWRDGEGGIAYLEGSHFAVQEAEADINKLLDLRDKVKVHGGGWR